MKSFFLIIALFIYNLLNAQCSDGNQLVTPAYHKILFFDDNHGFAFGHGTIITTDDAGENWRFIPLSVDYTYYETLKDGVVLNENSAILAGHNGTLLKTNDMGSTWNALTPNTSEIINFVSIDFVNDQVGYLTGYSYGTLGSNGRSFFLKTTNGGETWLEINNLFSNITSPLYSLYINFINEEYGFAWSGRSIYKTLDGGLTWQSINNPSGTTPWTWDNIQDIQIAENGTYVLSFEGAIYTSSDQGNTWTIIDFSISPNSIGLRSDKIAIRNNTLYFTGMFGSPYILNFISYDLTNSNFNFTPLEERLGYRQSDIYFFNNSMGFIVDGSSDGWNEPGNSILKTIDTGLHWDSLSDLSMFDSGSENNLTIKKNSDRVYTLSKQDLGESFISDFYIYTSVDDGATWQKKAYDSQLRGKLLYAESDYISYIRPTNNLNGAEGFSLYESYDLGETWESSIVGNFETYNFEQFDENTLFYNFIDPIVSFDKGQTWTNIPAPPFENVIFTGYKYKNTNEIYSWGLHYNFPENSDYYLFKTEDLGQTWEMVVTIPDSDLVSNYFETTVIDKNTAFVSTGASRYFTVDLRNNTYQLINFNNPESLEYVSQDKLEFLTENTWLMKAVNSNFNTYTKLSVNKGESWIDIPCIICGPSIAFDKDANELLTFHERNGVERIKTYLPPEPIITGNNQTVSNTIELYHVNRTPETSEIIWTLDFGGTISNLAVDGSDIEVTWTHDGVHILKAMSINECGASDFHEFSVSVGNQMSLNKNNSLEFDLSPNPFTETLSINTENLKGISSTIIITSLSGQILYKEEVINNKIINLSNLNKLATGVYFLTIDNNGLQSTKKILKN